MCHTIVIYRHYQDNFRDSWEILSLNPRLIEIQNKLFKYHGFDWLTSWLWLTSAIISSGNGLAQESAKPIQTNDWWHTLATHILGHPSSRSRTFRCKMIQFPYHSIPPSKSIIYIMPWIPDSDTQVLVYGLGIICREHTAEIRPICAARWFPSWNT